MERFEYLFVRADRLALGDVLNDIHESATDTTVRPVTVRSLELIGDDVEINDGKVSTSQGNVFWVRRKVMPVDMKRWQP